LKGRLLPALGARPLFIRRPPSRQRFHRQIRYWNFVEEIQGYIFVVESNGSDWKLTAISLGEDPPHRIQAVWQHQRLIAGLSEKEFESLMTQLIQPMLQFRHQLEIVDTGWRHFRLASMRFRWNFIDGFQSSDLLRNRR